MGNLTKTQLIIMNEQGCDSRTPKPRSGFFFEIQGNKISQLVKEDYFAEF